MTIRNLGIKSTFQSLLPIDGSGIPGILNLLYKSFRGIRDEFLLHSTNFYPWEEPSFHVLTLYLTGYIQSGWCPAGVPCTPLHSGGG